MFALFVIIIVTAVGTVAHAQRHTVNASIKLGAGSVQAKSVPGEFTVPAGKSAVNLHCFQTDPATGWTSDVLCSVYSVSEGTNMLDAYGNPVLELPPGTYRFSVCGKPGAYGTFSYELVP